MIAQLSKICAYCDKTFSKDPRYGRKQWNNQRFCSDRCRAKGLPSPRKGKQYPHLWKDDLSYSYLHKWIAAKLGKPNTCSDCGITEGKFEWANLSGKYKRNLSDWIRLCTTCHRKMDMKGRTPWNKGKKGVQVAWNKGKPRTWDSSGSFKKGHIPWNKGIPNSGFKKGYTPWNKKPSTNTARQT